MLTHYHVLSSWKILNGHISATGHLIHLMFGFTAGFSVSVDRMAQLPVGGCPPSWEILNGNISAVGHPIHSVFAFIIGFSWCGWGK